jgi:hypothetical protein
MTQHSVRQRSRHWAPLGNAVVLTHEGYGHISVSDPSQRVMRDIRRYFVRLIAPRRGTVCQSGDQPFSRKFGQAPT